MKYSEAEVIVWVLVFAIIGFLIGGAVHPIVHTITRDIPVIYRDNPVLASDSNFRMLSADTLRSVDGEIIITLSKRSTSRP
jgi:hypothetical protein